MKKNIRLYALLHDISNDSMLIGNCALDIIEFSHSERRFRYTQTVPLDINMKTGMRMTFEKTCVQAVWQLKRAMHHINTTISFVVQKLLGPTENDQNELSKTFFVWYTSGTENSYTRHLNKLDEHKFSDRIDLDNVPTDNQLQFLCEIYKK